MVTSFPVFCKSNDQRSFDSAKLSLFLNFSFASRIKQYYYSHPQLRVRHQLTHTHLNSVENLELSATWILTRFYVTHVSILSNINISRTATQK